MNQPTHDPLLPVFLGDRDTPCPGCGYNLRGLTSDVCPECAQAIRLGVVLVEPRLAAFLVGVIGLAFGIGFELIVVIWGAWAAAMGGGGLMLAELVPLLVGLAVECGLLWWWISARPGLRRLPLVVRSLLAVSAWPISAAFAVWFFARV